MNKVLRIILILLGVVCIAYCLLVLSVIGTGSWFNFAFGIIGAFLLACGILGNQLVAWITKWPMPAKIIVAVLCVAVILNFAIFEIKVIHASHQTPDPGADVIIVLGAKVKNTGPSREFAVRLQTAADYAIENPKTYVFLTGGQGSDEPQSEAEAGFDYMISRGISKERLLFEKKSTSTIENFSFAKDVLEKEGLYKDDMRVVVCSSEFHLYRAGLLAKEAGFNNVQFLGSTGLRLLLPQYYLREYAAYIGGMLYE